MYFKVQIYILIVFLNIFEIENQYFRKKKR